MSFLSLVGVELKKIKRSKIFLILFVAMVILWIPLILNAEMNFNMQAEGISPENNFFIQGFMGMAWFMFPASMVVGTVLLSQTERTNKGEEFIFGGTALERDNGSNLEATYSLTITSGKATLYWLSSGEEHIICEESADDTYKFTLSSGDNYIVLRGDDFNGNLELTVKGVQN